jgi:hypothetical protein
VHWLSKESTDEIVAAVPSECYAGDRSHIGVMGESNRKRASPNGRITPEAAQIAYRNFANLEDSLKDAKINLASIICRPGSELKSTISGYPPKPSQKDDE